MKCKCHQLHKFLIVFEIFYTIACFVNSVLIIKYEFYGPASFAFLLPLLGGFIISIIIIAVVPHYHPNGTTRDQYINDNYPDIWKRFYNTPGITCNPTTVFSFSEGKYDDGTDEKLNEIKFSVKIYEILALWPFFLAGIVLIFNKGLGG